MFIGKMILIRWNWEIGGTLFSDKLIWKKDTGNLQSVWPLQDWWNGACRWPRAEMITGGFVGGGSKQIFTSGLWSMINPIPHIIVKHIYSTWIFKRAEYSTRLWFRVVSVVSTKNASLTCFVWTLLASHQIALSIGQRVRSNVCRRACSTLPNEWNPWFSAGKFPLPCATQIPICRKYR